MSPKWKISYFQPILETIFVTFATVKDALIPDFNSLAIVQTYLIRRNW